MRRPIRKRTVAAALLALVPIFGLALLVHFLFDPAYYERILVSHIERRLNRDVTYQLDGLALWPGLGLRLRDVAISRKPPESGQPLITMRTLGVHVRLLPLLRRRLIVNHITIERPTFAILREKDGRLSFADLLGRAEERPEERSRLGSRIASLLFGKVTILDGRFALIDRAVPGRPVTTRFTDLDLELSDYATGHAPEFDLSARIGTGNAVQEIALKGRIGPLVRGGKILDYPVQAEVRTLRLDLKPLLPYFPPAWRKRVPSGMLTADLEIDGRPSAEFSTEGNVDLRNLELDGGHYRLVGNAKGIVKLVRGKAGLQGNLALDFAPGIFTKGSFVLDGKSRVEASLRRRRAVVEIDATESEYRHGDVFVKRPGTKLTVKGTLTRQGNDLLVRDAAGVLADIPFTGAAEIGKSAGPGRSTPFALHFKPERVELEKIAQFVAVAGPFALRGAADVSRLDIVRRPEEPRRWQVTTDFRLSNAYASIPLEDGRAHTVDALSADVAIEPGLLRARNGGGSVNLVPLQFQGEAREFMTILTGDPGRPRAQVRFEAHEEKIDYDRLLEPAGGARKASPARQPAPGAAWAQLPDLPAAPVTVTGRTPPLRRFVVTEGVMRANEATFARQKVTATRVVYAYDDPVLTLAETRYDAYDGAWNVTGKITLDGGPSFDLGAKVEKVKVEALIAGLSKSTRPPTLTGILDGEGTFKGKGRNLAAWEKTLEGKGQVVVRDGSLPGFNIFETILRAMLGLFSKIIPVKHDVTFAEPTTFKRFEQVFTVHDGRVHTDDLSLVTEDYRLVGAGSFGLDTTLDYDTQVALTPQGTQKMIVLASLPLMNAAFQNIPPVPMRVKGTFEKPILRPDVTSFSPGILRGILHGVGSAPTRTIEGGANVIKGILGGKKGEESDGSAPPEDAGPVAPGKDAAKDEDSSLIERGADGLGNLIFGK